VSACEQRSGQLSLSAQGEEYDLDKHSFLRWSFYAGASPLELLCYNRGGSSLNFVQTAGGFSTSNQVSTALFRCKVPANPYGCLYVQQ